MYSDIYVKQKSKFSSVLAVLAGVSILGFSLFFFGFNSVSTRASKKVIKRHEVVNLSTNQAGIFWQTEKKEIGWVVYGDNKDKVETMALDERDADNSKRSSYNHYVLLRNLDGDRVYYYKIVGNNEVATAAAGEPFSFRTAKTLGSATSIKPAYGKIAGPNGQPVENAFVFLYYPEGSPLLSISKSTGEWLIPLQNIVSILNGRTILVDELAQVKIEVAADDMPATTIMIPVKNTNPFAQTIIMGREYIIPKENEGVLGEKTVKEKALSPIDIVFPRENAVIPAVRPLLKGVALPGKKITLSINSQPAFQKELIVDSEGLWRTDIPFAVSPGSYTLIAETVDAKEKRVVVKRNFTVPKNGEQVLGEATGSASLTPIPTYASTTQITPTIPIATPTTMLQTPTPPVSGFDSKILMYVSGALILMGAGFLIVF